MTVYIAIEYPDSPSDPDEIIGVYSSLEGAKECMPDCIEVWEYNDEGADD